MLALCSMGWGGDQGIHAFHPPTLSVAQAWWETQRMKDEDVWLISPVMVKQNDLSLGSRGFQSQSRLCFSKELCDHEDQSTLQFPPNKVGNLSLPCLDTQSIGGILLRWWIRQLQIIMINRSQRHDFLFLLCSAWFMWENTDIRTGSLEFEFWFS